MKTKKMPSTRILLILSWLIAIISFCLGGFFIFFKFYKTVLLGLGFLILFGGIILAAVIRMLANIGQILFDLSDINQKLFKSLFGEVRDISQNINQMKKFFEQIEKRLDIHG